MEARMCWEFYNGLADISILSRARVHIIRFLPKEYRKEISDGKSYRVTAPVRTTVPQLLT